MTQISRDDVQKLARLSSLALADDEVDGLATDIQNILGYIEQLSELDTTGVEPTYQVTGLENVMRDDEIHHDVSREQLLALAPLSRDDQIQVPKVL
ncbi:MAG: Asp-tRNA(Asn)/Glu-tRNA(Gln) amidotransferase subunit GatC [Candidatus Saccharimonadales bacterium]